MMTREEVAEVITYCKKNGTSYKARLAGLGIPAWKFYDSKSVSGSRQTRHLFYPVCQLNNVCRVDAEEDVQVSVRFVLALMFPAYVVYGFIVF